MKYLSEIKIMATLGKNCMKLRFLTTQLGVYGIDSNHHTSPSIGGQQYEDHMKEQKGYAQLISSGHNNSNIIAPSYISDIVEPHDTHKKRSMSPRNRANLAVTAFKNAWTGINILVVVTIFN